MRKSRWPPVRRSGGVLWTRIAKMQQLGKCSSSFPRDASDLEGGRQSTRVPEPKGTGLFHRSTRRVCLLCVQRPGVPVCPELPFQSLQPSDPGMPSPWPPGQHGGEGIGSSPEILGAGVQQRGSAPPPRERTHQAPRCVLTSMPAFQAST